MVNSSYLLPSDPSMPLLDPATGQYILPPQPNASALPELIEPGLLTPTSAAAFLRVTDPEQARSASPEQPPPVFYSIASNPALPQSASSRSSSLQPRMVGGQRIEEVNNPITGQQFYPASSMELPPMTPVAIVPLTPQAKDIPSSPYTSLSEKSMKMLRERSRLEKTRRLKDLYSSDSKMSPPPKSAISSFAPKRSLMPEFARKKSSTHSSRTGPKKRLIFTHSRVASDHVGSE